MDVWVFVVLKSKIPNLASTIAYLRRYSNPNLAFSEAGYYLASVEFACQYLLRVNEQDYTNKSLLLSERIVTCEQARFNKIVAEEGAVFEIVSENNWLHGYELFAVKEWHLDPTRWGNCLIFEKRSKFHLGKKLFRYEFKSFCQTLLHPMNVNPVNNWSSVIDLRNTGNSYII